MIKLSEKFEASLMLASYLETVGFSNKKWEFNYSYVELYTIDKYMAVLNTLLHHYLILGGSSHINIKKWDASDDTIMILATAEAIIDGGGEDNYINKYIDYYDLLNDSKRASGLNTIKTIQLLKKGYTLDKLPIDVTMGGNGAAMRTGPIGLYWHDDIEKVISESIIASRITHNYFIGFLGGMVTAIFTSYAVNNINPLEWASKLIELYNKKIIHKYYPDTHDIEGLDYFFSYWKRYNEMRINKIKYKNVIDSFIFAQDRTEFLFSFHPDPKIKDITLKNKKITDIKINWNRVASSGLDCCIYAYDCLLMSMQTPDSNVIDKNNIIYSFETFMTLVAIHPGDNDTTAAIGGTWFGALNGYHEFNKDRIKELEFYEELKKVSNKLN